MNQLKNIAEIRTGIYLNSSPAGKIAYLQMKDLMADAPEKMVAFVENSPKSEKNLLQKGDLLFAGKGTTYFCRLFNLDIPAVASTTLYVIRLLNEDILPEFLCWYLSHPTIAEIVKASQIGSSTPLIRKSVLENLEIPIPDMSIQKKVVEMAELQKQEASLRKTIAEKKDLLTNALLLQSIRNQSINH